MGTYVSSSLRNENPSCCLTDSHGLLSVASRPAKNLRKLTRLSKFRADEDEVADVIWAPRDASFDVEQGERLMASRHDGFCQPMDTLREKHPLDRLRKSGDAPWKVWK